MLKQEICYLPSTAILLLTFALLLILTNFLTYGYHVLLVIFKVYDSDCNGKVTFDDIMEVLRDLTGSFISDKQREVCYIYYHFFPLSFFFNTEFYSQNRIKKVLHLYKMYK